MKAITIRQPWAQMIAWGWKRFETRSYRPLSAMDAIQPGARTLAIHAGGSWNSTTRAFCNMIPTRAAEIRGEDPDDYRLDPAGLEIQYPPGVIVATAVLGRVLKIGRDLPGEITALENFLGDYDPGRYAWELTDIRELEEPIPAKGRLGIWDWSPPEGFSR